jgi:molecular chaperone DnaK
VKDILLLDVTPLSLGVDTLGGIMTKVVEKNTTIPTKRTQVFSTAADFQTTVTIHVLQGERAMASDNISLGMFNLAGIPPSPRGVPQVEVGFEIDASGILNVAAKDLGTGKEAKITISASTKLSKEDKEKMVRDAEQYADQDKKKMDEAQQLNDADTMLYTAEKTKTDLTGKISEADVGKIDAGSRDLRKAIESKDFGAVKSKADALRKILQDVGSSVYQQAAEQGQAPEQPSAGGASPEGAQGPQSDGKVTDADYKVVEDEKK